MKNVAVHIGNGQRYIPLVQISLDGCRRVDDVGVIILTIVAGQIGEG